MVLPPGPITCLLACTRSCAKERRVPNYALHPERCAAILLNCWLSHSLLHICCMCVWGGSGRLRASTVGLNIKTGCIPAWSGMAWTWKDMLLLQFLTEKAWGGTRKRTLFTSSLEPTQILAFFFCHASVLLSFFLLCILCWPLPYWEGTCQLAGSTHKLRWIWSEHFYPNRHEDLKHVQLPLMDYGIRHHHEEVVDLLTGHPLVTLWSSSVKVYALSTYGKRTMWFISSV